MGFQIIRILRYTIVAFLFNPWCASATILPQYTITELGTLPGYNYAAAKAISESGTVVGTVSVFGQPINQAVLWKSGSVQGLGLFDGTNSYGYGINSADVAVGGIFLQPNIITQYPQAGFIVDQSRSSVLQSLDTFGAFAVDINNSGQILGGDAFWSSATADPVSLGLVTGVSLNNLGVAAGYIYSTTSQGYGYQAVTWHDGVLTLLGYLGAGCGDGKCKIDSVPADINDLGQVVGAADPYASRSGTGTQEDAFLWENGIMVDIGSLGQGSAAEAINNHSVVVGRTGYTAATGASDQAFIWTKQTGMLPLTDLITDTSGWRYLLEATDINDAGQIVGDGITSDGQYRAFRLDPISGVPEPGTLPLMMLGFALIAVATRR